MSASAIGSVTSTYSTQNLNNLYSSINADISGSPVSGAGGGRHHHGGGKFLQDVTQALQGMGLNVPGAGNTAGSASASPSSSSSSSSSSNVQQALRSFMYDLHQALGAQQQASATASTAGNKGVASPSGVQNGYGGFATSVQSLITSLNNNSNDTAAGGDGKAANNALQADFTNLVTALQGGSSISTSASTSSTTPTLQNFLQQLKANAANFSSYQNGVGSIIKTQA